jgi:hypothetical protein
MNYRNVCLGMQRVLQFVSRQHRECGNSDPAIWAVGLKLQLMASFQYSHGTSPFSFCERNLCESFDKIHPATGRPSKSPTGNIIAATSYYRWVDRRFNGPRGSNFKYPRFNGKGIVKATIKADTYECNGCNQNASLAQTWAGSRRTTQPLHALA